MIPIAFAPWAFLFLAAIAIGDYELFTLINRGMSNPFLDFACSYVSLVLFAGSYLLSLLVLYSSKDRSSKAAGIVSFITGPLAYGVGSLIKILVRRPRPLAAEVLSTLRVIGLWEMSGFSFPSTTTMLAFGFALPILLEKPRGGALLVALSYFMGFSVIYMGFHFPLDVAAGAIFSLDIALCTNMMKKPIAGFLEKHKPEEHENVVSQ